MKKFVRFIALTVAMIGASFAAQAEMEYEERVLGDPNAPVTMIEYASMTCPHCASFHIETLPQIKKDFIDTGKVKMIFRDFPFDRVGATAALISRCVAPERYNGFVDLLMKQQSKWARSVTPLADITRLAKLAGLSQEKVDSCLENTKLLDKIISVRKEAMDNYKIQSTPSFVINDEVVVGGGDYEKFKNIIESKL
ncbi:DsbA family protein [Terasakiella sp. A23]|uniref:DsbA family protein n=1 Tax=Terasakiella sp. FCG-A23 TaxID=3080561 RepID=UPI00295298C6|nr:DsbA family protein [Terasakiella sp. A23]MDV7340013.1 DsbA family protein [Terasakiella sp. A23]